MNIDPLILIGVLAVIVLVAFLLNVKWNFRGPQKSAPPENSAPQFHASSAPPRPVKKSASPSKLAPSKLPLSELTRRERDIVQLVNQDLTNDEIADRLNISRRTVNKHLENIFRKLEVRSRAELAERWSEDDKPN